MQLEPKVLKVAIRQGLELKLFTVTAASALLAGCESVVTKGGPRKDFADRRYGDYSGNRRPDDLILSDQRFF